MALTEISEDVGKLTELRTFYLGNNQIEKIPAAICGLKNLTIFGFASNKVLCARLRDSLHVSLWMLGRWTVELLGSPELLLYM